MGDLCGALRFGIGSAEVERARRRRRLGRREREADERGDVRGVMTMGDGRANVHWQGGEDEIGAGASESHAGRDQGGEDLWRGSARRFALAAIGGKDRTVDFATAGRIHREDRTRHAEGTGGLGVHRECADAYGGLAGGRRKAAGCGNADEDAGE